MVMMLLGAIALAGSAVAAFAENTTLVFVFAGLMGLSSTLIRPALQALLPSLVRTPDELIASNGATSTIESIGTLIGPLFAGVLVSIADVGSRSLSVEELLLAGAALMARVRVESSIELTSAAENESVGRIVTAGFRTVTRTPRARLVVALMVAQSSYGVA